MRRTEARNDLSRVDLQFSVFPCVLSVNFFPAADYLAALIPGMLSGIGNSPDAVRSVVGEH
jgi:hypothetical protein